MKEEENHKIIILLLENILGEEHKNLDYLYSIELIKTKEDMDKEEDLIPQNLKEKWNIWKLERKKIILYDNSIKLYLSETTKIYLNKSFNNLNNENLSINSDAIEKFTPKKKSKLI